jgi:ubiquinone biosynthesis protein COQ9
VSVFAGVTVSEDLKRAVLEDALAHAAAAGFSDTLLATAAIEAGAPGAERRLFPAGVPSLLEYYSHSVDDEMMRRLEALNIRQLPVRKRIRTAVATRLAILAPHKQAVRRATTCLALPHNALLASRLLYDTSDAMWRAAGDMSTDFNFYTKRGILGAVYSATLLRWFADTTPEMSGTMSFLDARIENVMQYEKLKKRVREGAKLGLDQFCDLLRHKA